MEDGFDVVILPLVVGEVLLGVGLPLLGQGLLLLQGKRLLLVSGKPLGVNLLLSLLLLALQLGLLLLLQEGVPLGGHHRVGVDGGPGGIHIQALPVPDLPGKALLRQMPVQPEPEGPVLRHHVPDHSRALFFPLPL